MANSPLVTTRWLRDRLGDKNIKPVDGSLHMPAAKRDAAAEFDAGHIPGAVFFDIDAHSDKTASAPHTLQSGADFANTARALGIGSDDIVIVYDHSDFRTGARVWWNFHVMGHCQVYVLDGGMAKWLAEGHPVETGNPAVDSDNAAPVEAHYNPAQYRTVQDVLALTKSGAEQLVDARAAKRFEGSVAEPRPGLNAGHIPGARNLPFGNLYHSDGTMLPEAALKAAIKAAGIDMNRPIVTSCGSGVTACILKLAFAQLGKQDVAIYDGSWTEWASNPELPFETGPAK